MPFYSLLPFPLLSGLRMFSLLFFLSTLDFLVFSIVLCLIVAFTHSPHIIIFFISLGVDASFFYLLTSLTNCSHMFFLVSFLGFVLSIVDTITTLMLVMFMFYITLSFTSPYLTFLLRFTTSSDRPSILRPPLSSADCPFSILGFVIPPASVPIVSPLHPFVLLSLLFTNICLIFVNLDTANDENAISITCQKFIIKLDFF